MLLPLLIATAALAVSCGRGQTSGKEGGGRGSTGPAAELAGITMTEFRKGARGWVLTADRGTYSADRDSVELSPIRMTLYPEGRPPLRLSAPSGVMTVSTRSVVLPDGISGDDDQGMRFEARRAVYSNRSSVVMGEGAVRYSDPMLRISGRSFRFSTDTRILSMAGGVDAVVLYRGGGS